VAGRSDVSWIEPAGGICAFLRLEGVENTAAFAERLFTGHGVAVAEGELFGCPGWIRVAFGGPAAELQEGLRRLATELDTVSGRHDDS
jgi:aspartate/methionine/tyrosine aminotransferase